MDRVVKKRKPRPDMKKGGKNYDAIVAGIRGRFKEKTLDDRIKENVTINNATNCHEWQGARAGAGYGYFTIRQGNKKKNHYVHRAVYEAKNGAIPKGRIVMHSCDNPCCCNIDHLMAGTHSDNTKDMINKNRHPNHMRSVKNV